MRFEGELSGIRPIDCYYRWVCVARILLVVVINMLLHVVTVDMVIF